MSNKTDPNLVPREYFQIRPGFYLLGTCRGQQAPNRDTPTIRGKQTDHAKKIQVSLGVAKRESNTKTA